MTEEKKQKIIKVMCMVAEDVEQDAKDFDGKEFTGKTMAEYMGNHGAAIAAIANAVKTILEDNTAECGCDLSRPMTKGEAEIAKDLDKAFSNK